ncbi:MAG: class I SAM-dependent methyltransferase [Patescibacteria group bacterium UBA2103]
MLSDKFWNKYFEVYDVLNELYPYQHLTGALVKVLDPKEGEKVLDAGSGTGNVSKKICAVAKVNLVTLDISDAGTRLLLEKIPDAEAYIGSLTDKLPFEDETFDKVVSNNVIYTLPEKDRESVAKEFYRVLKPGGVVAVSNISPGFSPMKIYNAHLKEEMDKSGFFGTCAKILKFVIPTLQIFWFNARIKMENKDGAYAFLDEDSQEAFLKSGGFKNVEFHGRHYGDQAVMHKATK